MGEKRNLNGDENDPSFILEEEDVYLQVWYHIYEHTLPVFYFSSGLFLFSFILSKIFLGS